MEPCKSGCNPIITGRSRGWGKMTMYISGRPTSRGGREASTGAYSPPEGLLERNGEVYRCGRAMVMKETDTLKKHVVNAESTLFAICVRTKVAKIDYMSFALTKKGEGAPCREYEGMWKERFSLGCFNSPSLYTAE